MRWLNKLLQQDSTMIVLVGMGFILLCFLFTLAYIRLMIYSSVI